jgi:2-amino-4-hydroxy-6-hydroxymethyldihydropteridine diphosphokinase
MAKVFIGIGSNMGDRAAQIALARRELAALPQTSLAAISPVYETAPVGPLPQGPYLNAAARLETLLDPHTLLVALRAIEAGAGRQPLDRRQKWGPRELDLDILLYDNRVIAGEGLVVPHPLMQERWFVLRPLADLDPQVIHPLLKVTVGELLRDLELKQGPPAPPK